MQPSDELDHHGATQIVTPSTGLHTSTHLSQPELAPQATTPESRLLTTDPATIHAHHAQVLHQMELLAEKPSVNVHHVTTGQVSFKKVIRQRTIEIPVELTEEVLVIEYQQTTQRVDQSVQQPDTGHYSDNHVTINSGLTHTELPQPTIVLNGETIVLQPHQSIEIPLYSEQAVIQKQTVVTERIDIGKIVKQHQQHYDIALQHEELDITEQPAEGVYASLLDPKE